MCRLWWEGEGKFKGASNPVTAQNLHNEEPHSDERTPLLLCESFDLRSHHV